MIVQNGNIAITVTNFQDVIAAVDSMNKVREGLATAFLTFVMETIQEKFPWVRTFTCETEYHYNDETYVWTPHYMINGDFYFPWYSFIGGRDNGWGVEDERDGAEHYDSRGTEFLNFWESHNVMFHQLFGQDYVFSMDTNTEAVECTLIHSPNFERY